MFGCDSLIGCLTTNWSGVFEMIFAVIAAASAITAVTPTPKDDRFVGKIYKVLEALALNVGYAKDKPAKKGGRFVPS